MIRGGLNTCKTITSGLNGANAVAEKLLRPLRRFLRFGNGITDKVSFGG